MAVQVCVSNSSRGNVRTVAVHRGKGQRANINRTELENIHSPRHTPPYIPYVKHSITHTAHELAGKYSQDRGM